MGGCYEHVHPLLILNTSSAQTHYGLISSLYQFSQSSPLLTLDRGPFISSIGRLIRVASKSYATANYIP